MKFGGSQRNMNTIKDFTKFNQSEGAKEFRDEAKLANVGPEMAHNELMKYFKDNYRAPQSTVASVQQRSSVNPQGLLKPSAVPVNAPQDTTPESELTKAFRDRQELFMQDPSVKQKVLGM